MVTVLQKSSTRERSWSTGQNHCCANTDVDENRVAHMANRRRTRCGVITVRTRIQIFFTIFFIYIEKKEKKYEEEKDRGKGRRDALYVFFIVRSSRLNIAKGKILFAEKENKKWNSRFFFPLLPISLFTACFSRIFSNFSREIIGKLRIAFTFAIVKYAIKICFVTLRSLLSLNAWMKRSKCCFFRIRRGEKNFANDPSPTNSCSLNLSRRFQPPGGGTDESTE